MIGVTFAMIAGLCYFNRDEEPESVEAYGYICDPNSLTLGTDVLLKATELQQMKTLAYYGDKKAAARVYRHYAELKDEEEAKTWLMICLGQGCQFFLESTELQRMQMLAEQGDRDRVHLHYGIAVRDARESHIWLKKAAALGDQSAIRELERKGHGRIETRHYYQSSIPESMREQTDQWSKMKTLCQVINFTERDGKETSEVRYYRGRKWDGGNIDRTAPSFCWRPLLAGASHRTHREPESVFFHKLLRPLLIAKGTAAIDAGANGVQFLFTQRFIDSLNPVGQSGNRPWREYFRKWLCGLVPTKK
jgi:hypothetical protein